MESKSQQATRAQWQKAAIAVIAATRRDAGLTQEQLAKKLGWGRSTVADIETGRHELKFSQFMVLAQALRIPPEVMLQRVLTWHGGRR